MEKDNPQYNIDRQIHGLPILTITDLTSSWATILAD